MNEYFGTIGACLLFRDLYRRLRFFGQNTRPGNWWKAVLLVLAFYVANAADGVGHKTQEIFVASSCRYA